MREIKKSLVIRILLGTLAMAVILFMASCKPADYGSWSDLNVTWRRSWGTGASGAYSSITLYWHDKTRNRTVQGPVVGNSHLEVSRSRQSNGEVLIVFKSYNRSVSWRFNENSSDGLAPFEMHSRTGTGDDRFVIFDSFVGKPEAVLTTE